MECDRFGFLPQEASVPADRIWSPRAGIVPVATIGILAVAGALVVDRRTRDAAVWVGAVGFISFFVPLAMLGALGCPTL